MNKEMIPQNRRKDITYGRNVCTHRSEKTDPYRTRITMGGNLINYPDDCGTPTADLHSQAAVQQYHLHPQLQVHDNRHQGLLPHDTHGSV